jgi:hypothetical protein
MLVNRRFPINETNLEADVMHSSLLVLLEEAFDGTGLSKRVEELPSLRKSHV